MVIKQIRAQLIDFILDKCSRLLKIFHCQKDNEYLSFVFKRKNRYPIMVYKPHLGRYIKGAIRQMYEFLKEVEL